MLKFLVVLFLVSIIRGHIYKTNITDFSRCKTYYSISESSYTKFFNIDHPKNDSLIFDFHFSVLAPSDAHILTASTANILRSTPVYEIVLGAGLNTFSDIRRLQKNGVKATARTKSLLSRLDIRSFWLHITKDGVIQVGRETEELAFLSWRDPDPIPVQVFSFNTWSGIDAKWFYDCPKDGGPTLNSEEIMEPLSDSERLKKDLLTYYDPYTRPVLNEEDPTLINIKFTYERINMDVHKAKMSIQGTMILEWKDEKILWDPLDYGNITNMNVFFREIWKPNLGVLNSASGPGSNFLKSTLIEVSNDGSVIWKAFVDNTEFWCDATGLGSVNWPADKHICDLQFAVISQENKYILQTKLESNLKNSEWEVLEATAGFDQIAEFEQFEDNSDVNTNIMRFKIRRISGGYTAIYFAPLVAVAILMLLTFWLSPLGSYRISLNCIQLVLLAILEANLALKVPPTYNGVPSIILLYNTAVIASLFSLFVSVIMASVTRVQQKSDVPEFLYKIITSYYLTNFISLEFTKGSESYDNLLMDNSSTSSISRQEAWRMLAKTFDIILFIIYFIGICTILFRSV